MEVPLLTLGNPAGGSFVYTLLKKNVKKTNVLMSHGYKERVFKRPWNDKDSRKKNNIVFKSKIALLSEMHLRTSK